MEIVLVFLVLIIVLAIFDLYVGVANDAVNFLNSAIGSKTTSFRKALFVASLGLIVGVTLSSGMMEITRKGIFNPSAFTLYDVMIIFVSFAITDILLLDFFNTIGIPTSTTVSMLSSLTGASLGLTVILIVSGSGPTTDLSHYMNLGKLTVIYTAILLSIVVSFLFGYFTQFISRIIFSFSYQKVFRYFGPIWAGIAITMIFFFVSVKGLEGASFVTEEIVNYISENLIILMLYSFLFWTLLFYIFEIFLDVNKILRFIVLIGTFSLAMSFASNDLVNYIGPSVAAWNSYNIAITSSDPLNLLMDGLKAPIKTPTSVLLLSGVIMVLTLFLSKKARTVTKTEVSLGRQIEGYEGFEGFGFARSLVRAVILAASFFSKIFPKKLRDWVNSRFNTSEVILMQDEKGERAAFDLIRATVNLSVASALISLGTSLKLPLSTTYVTFIVAMSTAFADRAWVSENAVQRVSGILTVIGGWFLTAIICIIIAGIVSSIIYFTGIYGVLTFIALIIIIYLRTTIVHRRRENERKLAEEKLLQQQHSLENSLAFFIQGLFNFLQEVREIANSCTQGIIKHKLKELKKVRKQAVELQNTSEELYKDFVKTIKKLDDELIESIHPYSSALSDITIISNQVYSICDRCYNYLDNSQKPLTNNQISDLRQINKIFNVFYDKVLKRFQNFQISTDGDISFHQDEFDKETQRIYKTYLKAIKRPTSNINRAIMYLFLIENLYSVSKKIINLVDAVNKMRENIQKKLQINVEIIDKNILN